MRDLDLPELGTFTLASGGPELNYSEDDFEELLKAFVEDVYTSELWDSMVAKKREFFKKQLQDPDTVVVFHGEKLVGFGGIREWPTDSGTQDIYVELKSVVVSKSFRGGNLAKMISAAREKNAVEKGKRVGKGCVLFFMTTQKNVMESAEKRGYSLVLAKDWVQETRPNTPPDEQDALVHEIEVGLGLKIFRNDSMNFKNARKVDDVRQEEGMKLKAQTDQVSK